MSRILWCLRLVVVLQCIGLAGKYFLSTYESESDVYGFLFFDHGWPESVAQQIDDAGAITCLVAGLITVLCGLLFKPGRVSSFVTFVSLLTVFVWFLAISITHMLRGEPFALLSLGEHAVRYTVPFALAILLIPLRISNDMRPKSEFAERNAAFSQHLDQWAMTLLVLASSATFLVHGYKAFVRYGPFTDLILLSDARWFGLELSQSTAESALVVIGIIDILVALLLITTRWRVIAIYMAFWGLLTSISRMTALGFAAWPETLIRAANWGAPLAFVIYDGWSRTSNSKRTNK
jgi:hypothetical protein